jgi:hypothetical protein
MKSEGRRVEKTFNNLVDREYKYTSSFIYLMKKIEIKKIENYLDAARSFNSRSESDSNLRVVSKPNNHGDRDKGFTEYAFNDGVTVRHSWNSNIYFGHKDYDHNIEVVDNAGYEFEKKSLSYNMQRSKNL